MQAFWRDFVCWLGIEKKMDFVLEVKGGEKYDKYRKQKGFFIFYYRNKFRVREKKKKK